MFPTRLKKPTQRAIEVIFRNRSDNSVAGGMFYTHDFGDGATRHRLEGHLTDQEGRTLRLSFDLSGLQFVPVENRGRPKKTARNVAFFLAHRWFLGIAIRTKKPRAESKALDDAMLLWQSLGFQGVSDEAHARKLLKAGKEAACGLSLLHVDATNGAHADGVVIAADESTFDMRPGEYMGINGDGWFWRYGMEKAEWGKLTAGAHLTKP